MNERNWAVLSQSATGRRPNGKYRTPRDIQGASRSAERRAREYRQFSSVRQRTDTVTTAAETDVRRCSHLGLPSQAQTPNKAQHTS